MPSLEMVEAPVAFHLSLNVPDLGQAIDFYRALFGVGPAKRHDDYAKFEVADPPVVFSLAPHPPGPGASLSHIGFRVASDDMIDTFRQRLEAAGICTQDQNGTTCGYAKQNKLWVTDPFGNFWEIYRIEADVPPESVRTSVQGKAARADAEACAAPATAVTWEHYVTHPLPDHIPHADDTLDEVRLTGTFNSDLTEAQRAFLVGESLRVLKPGGKVVVHGLMADRPFVGGEPKLPGLAAMVSRVPVQTEPVEALAKAGFVGGQAVKFDKPWFTHGGADLREVKWVAWKPATTAGEPRQLLYKGPFSRATADGGHTFERGKRATVPAVVWHRLRLGSTAEQFVFFESGSGCGK